MNIPKDTLTLIEAKNQTRKLFLKYQTQNLKTKYKHTEHKIIVYNGTIVTSYDGSIKFYIDENNRYGNHVGSSILANHPDVVLSNKVSVSKPCVDFARLLRLYTQTDFVVVKMDIEGAEFELLIR